ncbi:AbiH family protein [Flavobacterium hauense]
MNRLVIVGNGFDLAHGLPTGYCDFIDDYWRNVFSVFSYPRYKFDYQDEFIRFNFDVYNLPMQILEEFRKIETHLDYIKFVKKCSELRIDTEGFNYIDFTKNDFFQIINNRHYIQNWVDIENEYYKLLKDCLKEEGSNSRVKKLNEEFEEVKKLLDEYLKIAVNECYDFSKPNDFHQNILKLFKIKVNQLRSFGNNDYLKEFPNEDHEELFDFDNTATQAYIDGNLNQMIKSGDIQITNLFLNFNYTHSIDKYITLMNNSSDFTLYGYSPQIQIHGRLNDLNNQINFGFGDEMDDDYKIIEKKDDNEYLKNIKSFQYLQNSNYRDMLDFIDSDKFQLYIMGHSCGLSDRILLNKIFEHHNCRSIKVFYHQFDEPKADGRTDNYTEIVQNISRHFNKKEMMREKIVNKSLCQPLPQNIRFAKKENGLQS